MSIQALHQGPGTTLESKLEELASIKTIDDTTITNLFCRACVEATQPIPFELARAVIDRGEFSAFNAGRIANILFSAAAERALPDLFPQQNSIAESLLVVAVYARQIANQIEKENTNRPWDDFSSGVDLGNNEI